MGPLQNGVRETCPSHRGLSPVIKMIKSPKKKRTTASFFSTVCIKLSIALGQLYILCDSGRRVSEVEHHTCFFVYFVNFP